MDDAPFIYFYFVYVSRQVDSPALAAGLWFDDEGLCFALLPVRIVALKIQIVVREDKCHRKEIVLLWLFFSQLHEVLAKVVLTREYRHS